MHTVTTVLKRINRRKLQNLYSVPPAGEQVEFSAGDALVPFAQFHHF